MNLKVVSVIVCLCALAITSTEAGIPKCCVTTKKAIGMQVLRNVESVDVQKDTGACDIPALVLHVKGKIRPTCADPDLRRMLMRLQRRQNQRITFRVVQ